MYVDKSPDNSNMNLPIFRETNSFTAEFFKQGWRIWLNAPVYARGRVFLLFVFIKSYLKLLKANCRQKALLCVLFEVAKNY